MQYVHVFPALERVPEERAFANSSLSPNDERSAVAASCVLDQRLDRRTFMFASEQHTLTLSLRPQPGNKAAVEHGP